MEYKMNGVKYLSNKELRLRGWTSNAIKLLLKPAFNVKMGRIKFYIEDEVFSAESTDTFKKLKCIPVRLIKSEELRLDFFKKEIDNTSFTILYFRDHMVLFREAVNHYNNVSHKNVEFSRNLRLSFL